MKEREQNVEHRYNRGQACLNVLTTAIVQVPLDPSLQRSMSTSPFSSSYPLSARNTASSLRAVSLPARVALWLAR